jgi:hypothetical protein
MDASLPTDAPTEPLLPTFCDAVKPTPRSCADFDRGGLKDEWDNKNRTPDLGESGGGAITTGIGLSPPNAASLRVPALVDKSASASAILVRSLHELPPEGFTATVDLRIDTEQFSQGQAIVSLMQVLFDAESATLFRGPNGTYFASSVGLVKVAVPLPVGAWKTVQIQVRHGVKGDAGAPTRSVARLTIDTFYAAFVDLSPSVDGATDAKLVVGPAASGPLFPFAMHVDNVRVQYDATL